MRKEADREIGIAEDITTNYLERQRIEHERDFDVLTGLYNRFSFQRHMDYLFEHSEQLKIAALVMIDLDNLKKSMMLLDMIGVITIFTNVENVSKKMFLKKQFVRAFQEMSSIYSYMVMTVKKKYDKDLFQ